MLGGGDSGAEGWMDGWMRVVVVDGCITRDEDGWGGGVNLRMIGRQAEMMPTLGSTEDHVKAIPRL